MAVFRANAALLHQRGAEIVVAGRRAQRARQPERAGPRAHTHASAGATERDGGGRAVVAGGRARGRARRAQAVPHAAEHHAQQAAGLRTFRTGPHGGVPRAKTLPYLTFKSKRRRRSRQYYIKFRNRTGILQTKLNCLLFCYSLNIPVYTIFHNSGLK